MSYDRLLHLVRRGQEGDVPWVPIGQPKMDEHIGITKRMYHLIGGDPGTGKTSFVDQNYVLRPYHWYKHEREEDDTTKFKVIYFSMERSKENKFAKWVASRLWREEGILLDVPTIFGWGTAKRPLNDFERNKIAEYKDYYNEMFEDVHVLDGARNPTGVYKQMVDWALQHGEMVKRNKQGKLLRRDREKFIDDQPSWEEVGERFLPDGMNLPRYDSIYIPEDEDLITLYVIDHMGKVKNERGMNDKQTLDKMTEYNTIFRDFFGFCPVAINQFNRNNADIQRRINTDLSPEKQDFKGSGDMFEDADVVLALFNPHEFGITNHLGYKVSKMKNEEGFNRFRSVTILKNSYGIDNVAFGCQFIGECGFYDTLPKSKHMTDQRYDEVAYPNGIVN